MTQTLPRPITEYIEASNTFDGDRLIAAFADDALVNDARREFWGTDAIKRWSDREVIGDKVTIDVKKVKEHYGDFVVDAVVDEEFDKTNPPYIVILTHYFTVSDDKIVSLIIIRNTSVEYSDTQGRRWGCSPRLSSARAG
jgi:hypothetical protein